MDNASSEPRRLAALPGYDTAPDVYETPDLTDDTTSTTIQSNSSQPEAPDASDTSEEDDDEGYGISRRRLFPERARNRFGATSARVETRGVDLSDRVDGRRKGYRVRKRGSAGKEEEEEEESLEQRIARLRREVEECKADAEAEKEQAGVEVEGDLEALGKLLATVEMPLARTKRTQTPSTTKAQKTTAEEDEQSDARLLSKVTAFDTRLAALEQALGASSLDSDAVSAPILPTLTLLDHQLSALTSATSLSSLEAASIRIAHLRREVHDLATTQEESDATTLSEEDLASLRSLYALLPTLQSLAPTVPAMITRLRSLRTLHTSAANAASELDGVEKRQVEMEKELQAWREGLEKVETAIAETGESNGKNAGVVNSWVKDLEARMKALGR